MNKAIAAFFLLFFLIGCTQQQALINLPEKQEQKSTISVSFEVTANDRTLVDKALELKPPVNAFEALKQATKVEYEQYPFGVFITSVAGLKAGTGQYWAIYVNDLYAEKGIDQFELTKDTKMKLVLEEIKK